MEITLTGTEAITLFIVGIVILTLVLCVGFILGASSREAQEESRKRNVEHRWKTRNPR